MLVRCFGGVGCNFLYCVIGDLEWWTRKSSWRVWRVWQPGGSCVVYCGICGCIRRHSFMAPQANQMENHATVGIKSRLLQNESIIAVNIENTQRLFTGDLPINADGLQRRPGSRDPGKGGQRCIDQILSHGPLSLHASKVCPSHPRPNTRADTRCRPPISKPKPNTRFLRNLVRETDSHNAALLARETADSKARLDRLETKGTHPNHDIRRRQLGNITALLSANASGKRKLGDTSKSHTTQKDSPYDEVRREPPKKRKHETSQRDHERDQSVGRRVRDPREISEKRSHRSHEYDSSCRTHSERRVDRDRKARSRSRSPRRQSKPSSSRRERSPARHPRHDRERDKGRDDLRRSRLGHGREHTPPRDEDSDPLEEIVGPWPPRKVQARGRGTTQASSGIDARFSEGYNPALDLSAEDGEDDDDWDMVLDRVKWRQQGAERLRAAGFTDNEVEGWKAGKKPEVRWAKSGEGREWDRGKHG